MRKNNTKKAFTLIEVLVALVVLSISLISVYSLLKSSLRTTGFSQEKMIVIERGYDRLMRQMNYPKKVYNDTETYDGVEIKFTFETKTTQIPLVQEVHMTVTSPSASVTYVYYTQNGNL